MKTLKRFFDDIHEIRLYLTLRPESKERFITLHPEDRIAFIEAATKFRRNGPRVKKDALEKVA